MSLWSNIISLQSRCCSKVAFPCGFHCLVLNTLPMVIYYVSPQVKTIEIAAQAIICQSGGINGMNIDPDGGDSFN